MNKIDELIAECNNRAYRVEVGYCSISGISVCISKYNKKVLYYIDHQKTAKKGIKKALKWIKW